MTEPHPFGRNALVRSEQVDWASLASVGGTCPSLLRAVFPTSLLCAVNAKLWTLTGAHPGREVRSLLELPFACTVSSGSLPGLSVLAWRRSPFAKSYERGYKRNVVKLPNGDTEGKVPVIPLLCDLHLRSGDQLL